MMLSRSVGAEMRKTQLLKGPSVVLRPQISTWLLKRLNGIYTICNVATIKKTLEIGRLQEIISKHPFTH